MAAVLLWVRGSWRHGRVGMLGVILLCGVAGAVVLTVAAGARRSSTSLDRLADATGAPDVLMDVTDADTTARDAVDASPIVADLGELSVVFAMVDGSSKTSDSSRCAVSASRRDSPRPASCGKRSPSERLRSCSESRSG